MCQSRLGIAASDALGGLRRRQRKTYPKDARPRKNGRYRVRTYDLTGVIALDPSYPESRLTIP